MMLWKILNKLTEMKLIVRFTSFASEGKYRYSLTIHDNFHKDGNKCYTYCEASLELLEKDMMNDWGYLLLVNHGPIPLKMPSFTPPPGFPKL